MPDIDVARIIAPDHFARQEAKAMWCDDPANLAMLIRWLGCKGLTTNWEADDYAYLLDKGHKWTTEWEELQAELARADEQDCA